ERTHQGRDRRELQAGCARCLRPRAGRFLGGMVRPLPHGRPDPRRHCPRVRRQADHRQGQYRRESDDAERVCGPRHPDHAALQGRQAARHQGRRPAEDGAEGLDRRQDRL
ncbi:MAG: Thioredoxin, partial [uncultured Craurococcus sp.]